MKNKKIIFLPYSVLGLTMLVELKEIKISDDILVNLTLNTGKTMKLKRADCTLGKCILIDIEENYSERESIKYYKNGGFSVKFKNDAHPTKFKKIDIFLNSRDENPLFMKFNSTEEAELWAHCN